ncbi:MAG: hypothetical protein AAFY71_07850 [Bacteroidota bacterium]
MAKFRRKKPKAPKTTASLQTWKNYESRLNQWAKDKKSFENAQTTKKKLIQKLRNKR